ncbi:hypothetical protein [Teredinibacter sp. KSP-S5-2]|uniref:hypothetical protein n=1 Tax=Teredinibacter sp. KSP-S5-2 TaxID=3034506 RepID=UPI002934B29E|nr:hypothetical protein [Teredinibacter sp. KSP-S5-2]WNO11479.1 hypothetical protein P5V12_09875 [Teredinibacter sp. KSP-S5-2]
MYRLTMEYAHHNHGESEDLGLFGAEEALDYFDKFDWKLEVERANELQRVSPTLSIKDEQNSRLIWLSAYGSSSSHDFVSECSFPGMVSHLFGLVKKNGMVFLHHDGFNRNDARKAIQCFVAWSEDELRRLYS